VDPQLGEGEMRVRHHAARLRGRGGESLRYLVISSHTYLYICYTYIHIYRERERGPSGPTAWRRCNACAAPRDASGRGRGGESLRYLVISSHNYLYVCYKHIYREREGAEWTHSLAKVKCVCGTTRRA